MSLRSKLLYRTTVAFTITLCFVLSGTYLLFQRYTRNMYYKTLQERANTAAFFYLEKDDLTHSKYQEISKKFKQDTEGAIRLYHAHTHTLYINNDTQHYDLPDAMLDAIEKEGAHTFNLGKRQFAGIFYKDNEGDFIIIASGIDSTGNASLNVLSWMLISFFVVGLALNYFISGRMAQHTFIPFPALIKNVKAFTTQILQSRLDIPPGKPGELNDLVTTFNYFLERLENDVQVQRSFLKNASHELKTPLTVIIGDIEVALKNPRENAEYVQLLESLKKDALQLKSIVEGLLMLSGLEMQKKQQVKPVRIDEVLWSILKKTMIKYPSAQIRMDFEQMSGHEQLLTVPGNHELLFAALSNLLDNAVKFSMPQQVDIKVGATGDALTITINDTGPGIPAQEKELVFELFYRSAQTRQIPGNGIGLYLTRQILDLHNITVEMGDNHPAGTAVRLIFPAA